MFTPEPSCALGINTLEKVSVISSYYYGRILTPPGYRVGKILRSVFLSRRNLRVVVSASKSRTHGIFRTFAFNRRRVEELVYCSAARFTCSRNFMVDRSLFSESTVGSTMGTLGCNIAVCTASRASIRFDRPSSCRDYLLERLAASRLRPNSLCSDRSDRRLSPPTNNYETNVEGADLGVNSNSHSVWIGAAVLGSTVGTTIIGSRFCVPIKSGEIHQ